MREKHLAQTQYKQTHHGEVSKASSRIQNGTSIDSGARKYGRYAPWYARMTKKESAATTRCVTSHPCASGRSQRRSQIGGIATSGRKQEKQLFPGTVKNQNKRYRIFAPGMSASTQAHFLFSIPIILSIAASTVFLPRLLIALYFYTSKRCPFATTFF